MVKKDSESDDYYEGVKKFDCSFADFDAYMNDLDMEIESRFGPIGLGLWLGNGVKKIIKEANANCVMGHRRQFLAELVVATIVADGAEGNTCCSVSHCAVRLSDPSQLA